MTEAFTGADDALIAALAEHARAASRAARGAGRATSGGSDDDTAVVVADRADGTVVRVADTVAKAHPPGTDPAVLARRLAVAAHPLLRGILLPPHLPPTAPASDQEAPFGTLAGRPVTIWPYGTAVDRDDPAAAPWAAAGVLLARLHTVDPRLLPGPLPAMAGPAKAARAMARLDKAVAATGGESAASRTVRAAWERLPARARDEAPHEGPAALCHGDLHLGQLVRHTAADGRWLLIDIDDLGTGDPAWDLARPAMWFAAGLLDPDAWDRFLTAYRSAGGSAVPADGDPWPRLDVPARALAVQTAALAVAKAALTGRELDEAESELVTACGRIAALG
ncbi:phosphotransferase family protein [Actinacidiphila alni]|uniref:phosphotransferase family protein n=1 Tax=Actinacidiphila alni TaxID=380248 RepID=UPI003453ED69